ncbi:MAG: hypothetical protein ACE5NC_03030 [Anaerolineae bacterium]
MHVLFLFVDGVGIGYPDPERNPLARAEMPTLRGLLGGKGPFLDEGLIENDRAVWVPTDATLEVPGLPQSATGQTAILTGQNASQAIGKHWGPWPTQALRDMLEEENLFSKVIEAGGTVSYVNAFPESYFQEMERGRRRYSAIPIAALAAEVPLLRYEDLVAGRAISAGLTNEGWRSFLGYPDAPLITPEEAGSRFRKLSQEHALVFFEYWLTDFAGHRRPMAEPIETLENLDQFLAGIMSDFPEEDSLLIMTSDHGNLEDLSTKAHTKNPVPTLLVGAGAHDRAAEIKSLLDILPAVLIALAE